MKIEFLGTRGNIENHNQRHQRHSSLLVSYYRRRVMVDCGQDWLGEFERFNPHAIVITHTHPDHAFGLKQGADCPVYATEKAWSDLAEFPLADKGTIRPREPIDLEGMIFEAFPVDHSTRAPAVGYRITAGKVCIFYVPDVVYIHQRSEALAGARLYIGDGATVTQSMVRKPDETLIGHTPIRTQLTWCHKEGVPEALFTHCGSAIVEGDERRLGPQIDQMAAERGVQAAIAYDGMERVLR